MQGGDQHFFSNKKKKIVDSDNKTGGLLFFLFLAKRQLKLTCALRFCLSCQPLSLLFGQHLEDDDSPALFYKGYQFLRLHSMPANTTHIKGFHDSLSLTNQIFYLI